MMTKKLFALVDCNNFYVSCERVFKPAWQNKPVVVLSNNDGCIIARSNEAKRLNIPMGAPLFKWQSVIKQHKVIVCSSNYALYGDMSKRVMQILQSFICDMEIYSIDEAFLRLDKMAPQHLPELMLTIRKVILQWIGLPVSIGVAPTKTLAKAANGYAKKFTQQGVYFLELNDVDNLLGKLNVTDIWGVGTRLGIQLNKLGIYTALDLKKANSAQMRKYFSVNVERIVLELNGIACLDLETPVPRQNIMSSKSFGQLLTQFNDIAAALANYVATACVKLRSQQSLARGMTVFLRTSQHSKPASKRYANSISIKFPQPLHDTGHLIELAIQQLQKIFKPGYSYQKTGVILLDLVDSADIQMDCFTSQIVNRDKLMQAIDMINHHYGKHSVYYAVEGVLKTWGMKVNQRSPRYTTDWNELLIVS